MPNHNSNSDLNLAMSGSYSLPWSAYYILLTVWLYCTVYQVMPVSADGLGIVFGCFHIAN